MCTEYYCTVYTDSICSSHPGMVNDRDLHSKLGVILTPSRINTAFRGSPSSIILVTVGLLESIYERLRSSRVPVSVISFKINFPLPKHTKHAYE